MTITSYDTINGEIVGSRTGTNTRVGFSPSARGDNTVAVDQTQTRVAKSRPLPYGTRMASVGDPRLTGFIARYGYRYSLPLLSDFYIRARHFSASLSRWTSPDAFRAPYSRPYRYGRANPLRWIDVNGKQTITPTPPPTFTPNEDDDEDWFTHHVPGNPGGVPPRSPYVGNPITDIIVMTFKCIWDVGRIVGNATYPAFKLLAESTGPYPKTRVPKNLTCEQAKKLVRKAKNGGLYDLCSKPQVCGRQMSIFSQRGMSGADICDELRTRMANALDCWIARRRIRELCPPAPNDPDNAKHDVEMYNAMDNWTGCRDIFNERQCRYFYRY